MIDNNNVLVIGPQLDGHRFEEGFVLLAGRHCPWNTCALWCPRKLSLLGFLAIVGDGIFVLVTDLVVVLKK
jgi:hypothetical protein